MGLETCSIGGSLAAKEFPEGKNLESIPRHKLTYFCNLPPPPQPQVGEEEQDLSNSQKVKTFFLQKARHKLFSKERNVVQEAGKSLQNAAQVEVARREGMQD